MSGWSSSMELQFKEQPTLLKPSASNFSCCIFKAPQSLVQINQKAYEPQIVSIGPYHHGKERLNMIEQHKPRFFSTLLERTKDRDVGLDDYFDAVASREKEIRDCYSERLCESPDLVKMIVLDACFIVEVFRIFGNVIKPHPDDPFLGMQWIFTFLTRDLLRIENQIPFFVLQDIFDLSKGDTAEEAAKGSLSELALRFFNIAAQRPQEQLKKFYGVSNVKHLLDLFRLSFIGHSELEQPEDVDVHYLQLIPSATQLLRSGIKLTNGDDSNLLNIQFNGRVIQIPTLTLDDFISSFFLNCVAYEQCYIHCSGHITSYITFMRCLVNKEVDAELLSDNQILVNYLGSNAEVATFFNELGKDCAIDLETSYLAKIIEQVNRYHRTKWHVIWAGTKREYFGSPWSFISAVAAFVLLVLTFLQAFYAVFAYYHAPK
ncbi:UPF0481 protein At3g47200-like [Syzygium oleosum]|uniref:UPF0481 protein At3g47200-like n=1 Tax=Syzygium oleosum TaxID=219896 RepID=UPI0011D20B0B|nr:UPF0481 protein At3g47200-like [Syzygium oleosum]